MIHYIYNCFFRRNIHMYKILIVEDDPNISSLLQSHIQK
ncbi:DNA-binding response regulator, partial [Bacillus paranthracis]|nr:DNA-binding response regulator [Bacillus paranthracis]